MKLRTSSFKLTQLLEFLQESTFDCFCTVKNVRVLVLEFIKFMQVSVNTRLIFLIDFDYL